MTLLDRLELESAAALVACVQHTDWSTISYDVRLTVLHQINAAIVKLRERHGLAPFDDSLPWSDERPTAFEVIRGIVTGYEMD
jgi:hypothetical protein